MTIKLAEFLRFKKFMSLTTSDVDAEALAALRQANKVLAANSLTWEMVLSKVVKIDGPEIEEFTQPNNGDPQDEDKVRARVRAAAIDDALQKVLDNTAAGSFRDFILSLEEQWRSKNWLTAPQREALFRAAARVGSSR